MLLVGAFVAVFLCQFFATWVVPQRTPPSWDETEYLRQAVIVYDTLCATPMRSVGLIVDGAHSTWHASLLTSVWLAPFFAAQGVDYMAAYAGMVALLGVSVLLAWATVWLALGRGATAAWAGAIAALAYLLAPMTLALGSMVMSEVPSGVAFLAALLAYVWARQRDTGAAWAVAGVLLALTLLSRAERGMVFIGTMAVVFCVDQMRLGNWRHNLMTLAGAGAIGLVSGLWLQRWLPLPAAWPAQYVLQGALAALAVVGVLFMARHASALHAALCYGGMAALLTCGWLTWSHHGTPNAVRVFEILAERGQAGFHGIIDCYVWPHLAGNYCGSGMAGVLKATLLVLGVWHAARRWPGLLVLLLSYVAQAWQADLAVARFLFHLHLIGALVMGFGAAQALEWLARARRTARIMAGETGDWLRLALTVLVIAVLTPGTVARGVRAFERYDVTTMPTFDPAQGLWHVLDVLGTVLPDGARFSVVCQNGMPFSYNTLMTHSLIKGRAWQSIGWPPTFENYLCSPDFDYHVILGPGPVTSAYIPYRDGHAYYARMTNLVMSTGLYRAILETELGQGTLALAVFKNMRGRRP